MKAYYNEIDPFCAEWLRNLIAAGHIAPGDVDERDIRDVRADDLRGYTQHHFFAGIAGWSHALRLAQWDDALPVWTGSCPCQPFSVAGQQKGFEDRRHLWPEWHRLIRECRPPTIFGEQVAGAIRHGWLDAVFSDLEGEGYACGAVVLPACSVGAPHIRQRVWFVADCESERRAGRENEQDGRRWQFALGHRGSARQLANGIGSGRAGFWSAANWLSCRDGKVRPVEPGTFPLAHGIPSRVAKLRAYGNAIVPQAAAEFIKAYASIT